MRTRRWVRLAVVVAVGGLVATVLFGTASPAPASGAPPTFDLANVPGLEAVTYGQNAAYVAHITNNGRTVLRNVSFHNPIPSTIVDGSPQQAVFQSSNCAGGKVTATEFACDLASKFNPGQTLSVTVAWKTPPAGSSPGCPGDVTLHDEQRVVERQLADVFARTGGDGAPLRGRPFESRNLCAHGVHRSVDAHDRDGSERRPGQSARDECLRLESSPSGGLVTSIEELPKPPDDPGTAPEASDICIPAPSFGCDQTPFVFSPMATFTFVFDNASLPNPIHSMYHNGVLVSTRPRDDPHVVYIKNQPFKGITTVVVESSTNGHWTGG